MDWTPKRIAISSVTVLVTGFIVYNFENWLEYRGWNNLFTEADKAVSGMNTSGFWQSLNAFMTSDFMLGVVVGGLVFGLWDVAASRLKGLMRKKINKTCSAHQPTQSKQRATKKDVKTSEPDPYKVGLFEYNMNLLETMYVDFSEEFPKQITNAKESIVQILEGITKLSRVEMCMPTVEQIFSDLNYKLFEFLAIYEKVSGEKIELKASITFNEEDHYWAIKEHDFAAPFYVAIRDLEVFEKRAKSILVGTDRKIRAIKKAYLANPNSVIAELATNLA